MHYGHGLGIEGFASVFPETHYSPISSVFGRSRAGMAQLSSAQRFQFLLVSNFYGWEYDSFTDVHHPKITVP